MNAGVVVRRTAIFAGVAGALLGAIAWFHGGVRGTAQDTSRRTQPPPLGGNLVPIAADASMGEGSGVRLSRDDVAVVDGAPLPYRAFEATWARQAPRPGNSVDQLRLHTEEFAVLHFNRVPTAEEPRPRAVEGPGSTRVTAAEAELEMHAGASFHADLAGDVLVLRHEDVADLTLRTQSLALERREGRRGADELHAASEEHVAVERLDVHVEGIGLDADLGRAAAGRAGAAPARLTLRRNVRATLLTRPGAITAVPDPGAARTPTTITCAGTAELEELEDGGARRPTRWKVRFEDDVHVTQGATSMRCDALEVVFRTPPRSAAGVASETEVENAVASGGVHVHDEDPARGVFDLTAERTVTTRDAHGGYDVALEGGTRCTFDGTLQGNDRGRVEITCAGPALVHADPERRGPNGTVLRRSRITFREDVRVRQWADGVEHPETEIDAPEVTLLGDRIEGAQGRLDPDTLTARGSQESRVRVRREDLRSESDTLTWRVLRESGVERLLLSGKPTVTLSGARARSLFEDTPSASDGVLVVSCDDEVELRRLQPGASPTAPPVPPGEAFQRASAAGHVVARGMVDGDEDYRIECDKLDADFDPAAERPTLRTLNAYGNVLATGTPPQGTPRRTELRGDRLVATFSGDAATSTEHADVLVTGDPRSPAQVRIEELDASGATARRHEIRAALLRHEAGGTSILAERDVVAAFERAADARRVVMYAGKLQATLSPPRGEDATAGRQQLLHVHAERAMRIESYEAGADFPAYELSGDAGDYDHVRGHVDVEGHPARGIGHAAGGRGGHDDPDRDRLVTSEKLHAEFDPAGGSARPQRVTCEGGLLRYVAFADEEERPGSGVRLRVTVRADGPIVLLPRSGSAERNVDIVWEEPNPRGGRGAQHARLLCDRADLTFDPDAKGDARDRVTRLVATGARPRPAQMMSKALDATADRVEGVGQWLTLTSVWSTSVHVVQREPSALTFTCESGRFNLTTQEFRATRMQLTGEGR